MRSRTGQGDTAGRRGAGAAREVIGRCGGATRPASEPVRREMATRAVHVIALAPPAREWAFGARPLLREGPPSLPARTLAR